MLQFLKRLKLYTKSGPLADVFCQCALFFDEPFKCALSKRSNKKCI